MEMSCSLTATILGLAAAAVTLVALAAVAFQLGGRQGVGFPLKSGDLNVVSSPLLLFSYFPV